MNGYSRSVWSLGLQDLSEKDRAKTWKPFVAAILIVGGFLAASMSLIWRIVG